MEIIQASLSCSCSCTNLQLASLTPRFSALQNHHSLSIPSRNSSIALNFPRKTLTTTNSILDDGGSGSAVNVIEVDPLSAVKKKATDISPELKGTCIYLVGISNTMKTSLGKLLADTLRYYFFDSDSLIEEAAGGKSAAQSFRERDEMGFRESETEVLKQLSSMGRLVVSVGNGAVQTAANLGLLRHGILVWIDVPLEIVAKEVSEDGSQLHVSEISPSKSYSEVFSQLTAQYEEMKGGYAIADTTVSVQKVASQLGYDDFDAVTTEDMGLEVLKEIEKLMRVKKLMEEAARPF